MGEETEQVTLVRHVFLGVNTRSGGQGANILLKIRDLKASIDPENPGSIIPVSEHGFEDGTTAFVHYFDMFKPEEREAAMQEVKTLKENGSQCLVVACGGDGTVKWVISLLKQAGLIGKTYEENKDMPVGMLPFGTGNDLSRVMGFGFTKPKGMLKGKDNITGFLKVIKSYLDAKTTAYDVWGVKVTLKDTEDAYFKVYRDKKEEIMEEETKAKEINFEMLNYCSSGILAKITYEFEPNRTKSATLNKLAYIKVGTGQNIAFTKPPKLKKFIESIGGVAADGSDFEYPVKKISSKKHKELSFNNMWSYSSGHDFWHPKFGEQRVDDRLLESFSLKGELEIGKHHLTGGMSKTAWVNKGNMFRFPQSSQYSIKFGDFDKDLYFQVDGEGLKMKHPASWEIRHDSQVCMLMSPKFRHFEQE